MKRLLPLIAIAAFTLPIVARRTNTQPAKALKPRADVVVTPVSTVEPTHVAVGPAEFNVAGYDKPLRSRRETMLITNRSIADVDSLYITIDYTDLQGRQLHHRSLWAEADIPRGSTRHVVIPSWDVQCSYVYRNSATPHSLHTPYDVTVTVDSAALSPS